MAPLGWLHFEYLTPRPGDWPYPHPDFLQVVMVGVAIERLDPDREWTDTEGWERSSRLGTVSEALVVCGDPVAKAFLRALDG